MGFIKNLFARASEIDWLTRQNVLLQGELDRKSWECTQLSDEVKAERAKRDKFMTQYVNQISVKNGLYGVFKESPSPQQAIQHIDILTEEQEDRIRMLAEEMRNDDINNNLQPRPLDAYIKGIRDNFDNYAPFVS